MDPECVRYLAHNEQNGWRQGYAEGAHTVDFFGTLYSFVDYGTSVRRPEDYLVKEGSPKTLFAALAAALRVSLKDLQEAAARSLGDRQQRIDKRVLISIAFAEQSETFMADFASKVERRDPAADASALISVLVFSRQVGEAGTDVAIVFSPGPSRWERYQRSSAPQRIVYIGKLPDNTYQVYVPGVDNNAIRLPRPVPLPILWAKTKQAKLLGVLSPTFEAPLAQKTVGEELRRLFELYSDAPDGALIKLNNDVYCDYAEKLPSFHVAIRLFVEARYLIYIPVRWEASGERVDLTRYLPITPGPDNRAVRTDALRDGSLDGDELESAFEDYFHGRVPHAGPVTYKYSKQVVVNKRVVNRGTGRAVAFLGRAAWFYGTVELEQQTGQTLSYYIGLDFELLLKEIQARPDITQSLKEVCTLLPVTDTDYLAVILARSDSDQGRDKAELVLFNTDPVEFANLWSPSFIQPDYTDEERGVTSPFRTPRTPSTRTPARFQLTETDNREVKLYSFTPKQLYNNTLNPILFPRSAMEPSEAHVCPIIRCGVSNDYPYPV